MTGLGRKADRAPNVLPVTPGPSKVVVKFSAHFACVCNDPAIGYGDHLTCTTLYDDDPSEEEIDGILLNCPSEIVKREI